MTRIVLRLLLVTIALAGCTPRGTITLDPRAASVGAQKAVFVATTRGRDAKTGVFNNHRSEKERFGRIVVSIPPDRKLGTIVWPSARRSPDPRRDFLTSSDELFTSRAAFRKALSKALVEVPRGQREAVVYVHGFNNTFAESVYRIAQLSHDLSVPGVAVAYSLPSAGSPINYAYDRDSVLFARDGLEQLLNQMVRAGTQRILLVAHSLGSELVMEVLRQMRLDRNAAVMSRISGVILISPDIDIEVFRTEAKRIGKLPQPFVIFTSQRDRALALSARLTGEKVRLGSLKDISRVSDLKVTMMEVGAFSKGLGHFTAGTSPALIKLLARMRDVNSALQGDRAVRPGLFPGFMINFRNATQIVLVPRQAAAATP